MPHLGRAPTHGVPPEFMQAPREHKAIPATTKEEERHNGKKSLAVPKLSLHAYEPDPEMIFTTLLGKHDVDPATGRMVPVRTAADRQRSTAEGHGRDEAASGDPFRAVFDGLAPHYDHRAAT